MKYDPNKTPERGLYYSSKGKRLENLFAFEDVKDQLPSPVVTTNQRWVDCYWYAWEIAFRNAQHPSEQSGFLSDFVDAAFNQDIFLWDTVFITMFADLAYPYLPGIAALDNFYAKQLPDGEIPREIIRETGEDVHFWLNKEGLPLHSYFHNHYGFRKLRSTPPPKPEDMYFPDLARTVEEIPYYTLDSLNHPILAWGEWVSYQQTGDMIRLSHVFLPLVWQYRFMHTILRHANDLYVTDWASMDNSPRNADLSCAVDISCEMVLFANTLLDILTALEESEHHPKDDALRTKLEQDRDKTKNAINALLWDEESGFYYDLKQDGRRGTIKTAAAFWALAAGVADEKQAQSLARWLADPETFNRVHRVPVLAADETGYHPDGGYWSGSVWAPMNTMIVYGLEKYGYISLAHEIGLNHLNAITKVWEDTGTIWENYPADSLTSGDADNDEFVGWSGIGPLRFLLRYAIGLVPDAPNQTLHWYLDHTLLQNGNLGCDNFRFGTTTTNVLASVIENEIEVNVQSDQSYMLVIHQKNNNDVIHQQIDSNSQTTFLIKG